MKFVHQWAQAQRHGTEPAIFISGASYVARILEAHPCIQHLVSVVEPREFSWMRQDVELLPNPPPNWHHCAISDLHDRNIWMAHSSLTVPDREQIEPLIEFLRKWNGSGSLLVHCAAGVSRSTAVGLTAHAMLTGDPEASAGSLMEVCETPYSIAPNSYICRIADQCLGFQGRLEAACQLILERTFGEDFTD